MELLTASKVVEQMPSSNGVMFRRKWMENNLNSLKIFFSPKDYLIPDRLQVDVGTLPYDYKVADGICVCNNPVDLESFTVHLKPEH